MKVNFNVDGNLNAGKCGTGVLLGLENVMTYTGTILIYSMIVIISRSMSKKT